MSRKKNSGFAPSPFLLALSLFFLLVFSGFLAMHVGNGGEIPWQSFSGTMLTGAAVGVAEQFEEQGEIAVQSQCGGATTCSCGDYVSEDYTLTDSLTGCSGHGLEINASSITLDCAGFTIGAGSNSKSSGIHSVGNDSVFIKNCNITQFREGIYFANGSDNNKVENVSFVLPATKTGVRVKNSNQNNFTNISILVSRGAAGMRLDNANDSLVQWSNITGNGSQSTNGIIITSSYRNTLRSNKFSYFNKTNIYAIQLSSSSNNTITNNTFWMNGYAVYISGSSSSNNTISENIITNQSRGIYTAMLGPTLTTIYSNKIYNSSDVGVYLESPKTNNVTSNVISDSGADGIYLRNGGGEALQGNIIQANNITNSVDDAIELEGGTTDDTTWIIGNNITTCSGDGLVLGSQNSLGIHNLIRDCNVGIGTNYGNVTVENNTIFGGGDSPNLNYGITLTNGVSVRRNTIYNKSVGIRLLARHNNTLEENVIYNNTRGVLFAASSGPSNNNTFINDKIFNNSIYDLEIENSGGQNNSLLNMTFNLSKLSVGTSATLYIRWFVDVNVTDNNSNVISGATVTGYDVTGKVDDARTTDDNGIARLRLADSYIQSSTRFIITNNHSIKASKANYTINTTALNLRDTNSTARNLSLTEVLCGNTLYSSAVLGQNLSAQGNCLTIGANDITIEGNSYSIIGDGTGDGINSLGKNSINITNLYILNFTRGLILSGANHSTFFMLALTDNSYGIVFNNSDNTSLYDTNVSNSTSSLVSTVEGGTTRNYFYNTTFDISNISISGGSVFRGWYLTVNTSIGNTSSPLGGATILGRLNSTTAVQDNKTSPSSGLTKLFLSDLEVNGSGTYYITPHNISAFFSSSLGVSFNSTVINLTLLTNNVVNLSLEMNCTVPVQGLTVTTNITMCPGTYSLPGTIFGSGDIVIGADNVKITCVNTVINGPTWGGVSQGEGIHAEDRSNIFIVGCNITGYENSVEIFNGTGIYINDSYIEEMYIEGGNVTQIYNSIFGSIEFFESNTTDIFKSTFKTGITDNTNAFVLGTSRYGLLFSDSNHILIRNTTFDDMHQAIVLSTVNNFTAYYNTFTNIDVERTGTVGIAIIYATSTYNITLNTSLSDVAQGNGYDDTCSMSLTDADGDGWYDSGDDYPFNETTQSKLIGSSSDALVDYGPQVVSCEIAEVQLGTGTGGGGGSSASAASAAAAAPAAPAPAAPSAPSQGKTQSNGKGYTSAEEVLKNIQIASTPSLGKAEDKKITLSLTNTGDKTAYFESEVKSEKEESFTVYQSKSLEHTAQSLGTGWLPTGNLGKERLTTISLPTDLESFSVSPGETKNIELDIGALSATKRTISFVLKEANSQQDVLEKETVVEPVWGNAVDHISEENLVDIYIVKPEEDAAAPSRTYTFEISVIQQGQAEPPLAGMKSLLARFLTNPPWERRVLYSETYGPRIIGREGFIFTQQYKYDCRLYNGKLIISVKTVDEKGSTIVDNEFPLEMGCNPQLS